jgi:hypothetical protein
MAYNYSWVYVERRRKIRWRKQEATGRISYGKDGC